MNKEVDYIDQLDQIKRCIENAKKISEVKPFKRPKKDFIQTMLKYKFAMNQNNSADSGNYFQMRTNYVTSKQHSSLRQLAELKPITLKDMNVNQIHFGYYLECEVISEPFYISGMSLIVKDTNGEIENLSLYNFNTKNYQVNPSHLMPMGAKFIIKEPYLKMYVSGNGEFGLRVDSPTDIIMLSFQCPSNKSIDKLIDEGNLCFKKDAFHLSILLYSQAIQKSENKNKRAFLNRSAAYLKLERYYQAFKDAQQAIKLDERDEKAYFRAGRATYLMRQFIQAKEYFETCVKINKQNEEAQIELAKSNERILESTTGNYDFEKIMTQYLKENRLFDVADFKSDCIAVANIPKKSKGVIATENIKKGTLLVASKAISAVFHSDINKNENLCTKINLVSKRSDFNDGSQNFVNTVYSMQSDPELAKQIYSLYSGTEYDRNDKTNEFIIDISRVDQIQKFNSFAVVNYIDLLKGVKPDPAKKESGLWLYPSFFNHSCMDNTSRIVLGDLLFLYAKRDIKKNEEITLRYFGADNYSERLNLAKVHYNFKCDCILCKFDRGDKNLKRRESLVEEIIQKKNKLASISLNELIEDVKKMRNLYANDNPNKTGLVFALNLLAIKYRLNLNFKKSAITFEEIYNIFKENCEIISISSLKRAYNDYKRCSLHEKCEWCYKTASEYYGNNEAFFKRFWEAITDIVVS